MNQEIDINEFFASLSQPVYGPYLPQIEYSYEAPEPRNFKAYALARFSYIINEID